MDDSSDARARTSERVSASAPMGGDLEPPRDGVERASGVERVARAAGRAMDGGARSTSTHGMSRRQPSGSRGASGARASGKRETSRLEMLEALGRELDETESLVFDAGAARRDAREDSRGQNDRAREASGSGTATTSMVGAFFGDAQERSRAGRASTEFYGADDGDADEEMAPPTPSGKSTHGMFASFRRPKRVRWSATTIAVCVCVGVMAFFSASESREQRAMRHIHLSSLSELSCENAFIPARAQGSQDTPVSRVIAATDHVYILTSQNCDSPNVTIRVPQEFADKASCVSGRVLDRCASTASGVWYESHYTRVSMSHGMIIKHAQESGFAHITVMEEDTVLNDDVGLTPETEKDVLALLADEFTAETSTLGRVEVATDRDTGASEAWKIIRPAFRPHLFERFEARPSSNGKGFVEVTVGVLDELKCPSQCHCRNSRLNGQLCQLHASGCDLRSSDMYFLNNRAYDEMLTTLFTATDDTIIDHFVLQNIDKTWLLHPSLTVQGHLDISNVLQHRVQELFETKCVK